MKKVTKIEESKQVLQGKQKLRVAAYCRVSTDSDAQLESLETQKSHYETYISSRDDWEYAGIYYDEGITGTKKEKRRELMRLLGDCEARKIDFVITKSISRFARNTTDCLTMVRKLQALNIPIYFESENLNTSSMESEMFLTLLSSMAEAESVSNSQNHKWAIKKRYQNGTFKISYPPYGYDWNGQEMIINEEQADIVRYIFKQFLAGNGTQAIADLLNKKDVLTKKGRRWTSTTINGMLRNEKYTGDVVFQKTYTDSQFNRYNNYGQKDQYMMTDHHEAIISREDFEAVSLLLSQRATEKGIIKEMKKYQQRYAFSGIIICGCCGSNFKRRTHNSKGNKYIAWCCQTHLDQIEKCSMLYLRDDTLQLAFVTMMNKLNFAHRLILRPLVENPKDSTKDANLRKIQEIQTSLLQNTEQRETLTRLMAQGYIDQILFNKENNELLMQADNYRKEIEALNKDVSGDTSRVNETSSLLRFAEKSQILLAFEDELFEKFVSHIIVYSRYEIGFELKCGLTLKERL